MPSPRGGNKLPPEVTKEMHKTLKAGKDAPDALAKWREARDKFIVRATEAAENAKPTDAKSYAVAAGIATEKVLLLENKPTAIIAGLHENRHLLPDVLKNLAAAAEIVRRTDG